MKTGVKAQIRQALGVSKMEKEKRNGQPPVPPNLDEVINPDQLMTLRQIENFGWQLAFVRRPVFQDSVVVVSCADSKKYGVLEDTGELNLEHEVTVRSQPS